VQKTAVIGNYFNRMANRMAKIQNRTLPAFRFIPADDFGLDFATARNNGSEGLGFTPQQLRQIAFQQREQFCIVNDAVFDDFGETRAEITVRQGFSMYPNRKAPGAAGKTHRQDFYRPSN